MERPYDWALARRAAKVFDTLSARRRQQLVDSADEIARHPFQKGQLTYHDRDGREMQVYSAGKFDIHYWCDHAVREVRISVIEFHPHG
jgi:hypothetical protein